MIIFVIWQTTVHFDHTTCLHRFSFLPDREEGRGILFETARTKFADKNKYPYIRVLLKLGCTIPLKSDEVHSLYLAPKESSLIVKAEYLRSGCQDVL